MGMRMSRLLVRTLREAPSDAEAASHKLLVRAGYIRRLASGIYTYLPLGWRVVQNVARIVREEMDAAGAQEMLMPALHPLELWQQTGRDRTMDDVLMHVDAKGGSFVLGPTHEEVVTTAVAGEVDSYRDLPLNVYQIQSKFRDEARPRFGLLRAREFVMKDAYSFDADKEGMGRSYQLMYDAYCRVFDRCGLTYSPVEAHAGAIGGDVNHEFMIPSAIGEDLFARCGSCGYAANVEAAVAGERPEPRERPASEELAEHHTPERPGIDLVVEFFANRGLTAAGMLKCIAFVTDDGTPLVALVPGDREVLPGRLGAGVRPLEDDDFARHPELVKGYIGPMGLRDKGVRIVADHAVRAGGPWVTGANRPDHHVTGATLGRDFDVDEWSSIASIAAGDPCARCGNPLELVRSVEAGHTFQLGLAYSMKIPGAHFLDEHGAEQPFWMGCYGIGVSRLPAVIAEEKHDDAGLVWPASVAPYLVHLLALGAGRARPAQEATSRARPAPEATSRAPDVGAAADRLYDELTGAGITVLYDDRDVSPGVKFADADLLGMPVQVLVGSKGMARGVVETKIRATGERGEVPLEGTVSAISSLVSS